MYEDTHDSDSNVAQQEPHISYDDLTYAASGGASPWLTTLDYFYLNTTYSSLGTTTVLQNYEEPQQSPRCLLSRTFSRRINSPQPMCVAPEVLTMNNDLPCERVLLAASEWPDGVQDAPSSNSSALTTANMDDVNLTAATEAECKDHGPTPHCSHNGDEKILDVEPRCWRGDALDRPVQISFAAKSSMPSVITSLLPHSDKVRSKGGRALSTSASVSRALSASRQESLDHEDSIDAGPYTSPVTEITSSRRASTAEVDPPLVSPCESSPAHRLHGLLSPAGEDLTCYQRRFSTLKSRRLSKKRIAGTETGGAILTVQVHTAAKYQTRSHARRGSGQSQESNMIATQSPTRTPQRPATAPTLSKRRRSDTDVDEDDDVTDNDSDYIPEESSTAIRPRPVKKRIAATRHTRHTSASSSSRYKVASNRGSKQTYYYRGTKKLAYCHPGDQKRLTISKCHRPVWCPFCTEDPEAPENKGATCSRIRDSPKRHLLKCASFKTSAYYRKHLKAGMTHEEITHYATHRDRKFAAALPCARNAAYKKLLQRNRHTHEEVLKELEPFAKIYLDGDCDCCPFDSISTYRKEPQDES
ncbi:hypothetical protein C8Q73DRAFT_100232 [Cubamyces lactineus]|nr:hypothetical protein C8Q73DRAFT_100232 [Cubamyces lactineus]